MRGCGPPGAAKIPESSAEADAHILAPAMTLRPADIAAVIRRYHESLSEYREALNELNVYPVPDGDTGTNMTLTVGSVIDAMDSDGSMHGVTEALITGSLMGARGNSGVILSQILRGLSDTFRAGEEVGVSEMVEALDRASEAAYEAVQRPVEGTILTVLRMAAEAARDTETGPGSTVATLLRHVYERAVEALESTPDLLPVLKQAGVVDAGGAGFLLLLASFLEVVTGEAVVLPERVLRAHADLSALQRSPTPSVADLRYEVMYLIETDDVGISRLRERWSDLGDSIVVVGGENTWNCHIHTDMIGRAIEAGIAVGTPRNISVTDLFEQSGNAAHHSLFEAHPSVVTAPIGVVSVVAGAGLVGVFAQLGVQGVVTGGQTMNPATEELLAVVDGVSADVVVVLPNNKNIVPVAEQLDALTLKTVTVVPTRSIQQGIAAMFGYDPTDSDLRSTTEDMAAAASSIVTGEITRAVRDANIDYGTIRKGDWLGIADGTIVVADADLETTLRGLVASVMMPGAELLTLYIGEGANQATTKALEAWLAELHPRMEVSVVAGGQPVFPYLVAIE